MQRIFDRAAAVYFVGATAFLMLLAIILLVLAVLEVGVALLHADVVGMLESAGLVIVGFAIVETSKFMAEEELVRRKELRSAVESRRSLTKFVTIIVIAISLEALVMVFEAGRTDVAVAIYPALLFASAMFALLMLGTYQWLSSRIAPAPAGEHSIDHRAAEQQAPGAQPADEAPQPPSAEA